MLLLDTNAFLWFATASPDLGMRAGSLIDDALVRREAAFSPVTIWEIALKHTKGKLRLSDSPEALWRRAVEYGFVEVQLDARIALESATMSGFGADPADRFIVATARSRAAELVTSDERILAWRGALARIDARL
jgi:PIN domain nuclease of toxin-antitoxin system